MRLSAKAFFVCQRLAQKMSLNTRAVEDFWHSGSVLTHFCASAHCAWAQYCVIPVAKPHVQRMAQPMPSGTGKFAIILRALQRFV